MQRTFIIFACILILLLGAEACGESQYDPAFLPSTPTREVSTGYPAAYPPQSAVLQTPPPQITAGAMAASYAALTLGVVIDAKMQIIDIDQGSAAEQAGLQRGDVLTAIDGLTLPEHVADAKAMLYEQGSPHRVEFTRNGATMQVNATLTLPVHTGPTVTPVFAPNDYL